MARERRQPWAAKTHPRRRNVIQPWTRLGPATVVLRVNRARLQQATATEDQYQCALTADALGRALGVAEGDDGLA
jgi:hypothetical protein